MHIPPLVFQPYIENAIWHGLMPKGSPGVVKLSIDRQGEYLHCAIEDDGIGREKATAMRSSTLGHKRSWGMQITSERLKFQNGEASGIHIIDLHDTKGQAAGTRVEITIKFT
jgi:sensor histidine kinase YesM